VFNVEAHFSRGSLIYGMQFQKGFFRQISNEKLNLILAT